MKTTTMRVRVRGCLVMALGATLWAAGCGGDSEADGSGGASGSGAIDGGSGNGGSAGASGSAGGGSGGSSGSGGSGGSGGSSGAAAVGRCGDPVPAGAMQAADPPAYSGGSCPTLAPGANTIQSAGTDRAFLLAVPSDLQPNEVLPVVFLWHWLGGDAQDFLEKGEVQAAVDAQRFVAVIPEKKGDPADKLFGLLEITWPAAVSSSQARVDEELTFFDDMLACVSQQYSVNKNCVSSVGVSFGALWTTLLAGARGDHLSSFVSLSGGCGGSLIKPWGNPAHKMPAIVLWGGPTDNCFSLMNFEATSGTLEDELTAGGHFFLECIHNCGHAEPPFDAPGGAATKYQGMWGFVLDHPFWLGPGQSPYLSEGLPSDIPTWCAIGKGSSTPRTGDCPNPPGC